MINTAILAQLNLQLTVAGNVNKTKTL